MTRFEWLLTVLIILQIAHILQEELARQRQKQAHQELMDLLIDLVTVVCDVFPYLKILIGLSKDRDPPDSISR